MSRSPENRSYKRVVDVTIGAVGLSALTLGGCARVQEGMAMPDTTSIEAPTTSSIPWPPQNGPDCDKSQLPAFTLQPGNTHYHVYDRRRGCTDNGVNVYETSKFDGAAVGELQPLVPFALECVGQNGDQQFAKIRATEIHPVKGFVVLSPDAVQAAAAIPGGNPACPTQMH